MAHRSLPILAGLAFGLALVTPRLAETSPSGTPEYSGGHSAPLAFDLEQKPSVRAPQAIRTVQNTSAPPSDPSSADARKKLKAELDRIRAREREDGAGSGIAKPPKPPKKKVVSPAEVQAETPSPQAPPQANRKVDPELDKALGRLLIVSFKGKEPADGGPKNIRVLLQSGLAAGAVFTSTNIQSKAQLKDLIKFIGAPGAASRPLLAVHEAGHGWDPFPAIKDFEQWPAQIDVAAKGDPEYAYSTYRSMGSNLAALGFNMNFGPGLGAAGAQQNGQASFGASALQTGVFAKTFILGHREVNVIPVPVVDGSELSVRALKTLLVSYPGTPIAAVMTAEIQPFALYDKLVRGPRFCFVMLGSGDDAADAAGNFNRGCDVLVMEGSFESPTAVRDQLAQGVADAIKHGELSLEALNASAQRLSQLRSSTASTAQGPLPQTADLP